MSYFKNQSGDVFFIAPGGSAPDGATPMTEAEVQAHLNPQPTPQELQRAIGAAVDRMLDELAQSWRYQDSTRLLAAKGSSNAKYAAEGTTFEAYWSSCWALLDELEAAVIAGTAQMPATVDEVLAMLPEPPARPVVP